jgi:hypothetical protein
MQAGHRVARFPCTHVLALLTLLRKETPFFFFLSFLFAGEVGVGVTWARWAPTFPDRGLAVGPLAAAGVRVTGLTPALEPRAAEERVLDAKPVSPDAFLLFVFALGPLAAAVVRVAGMGRNCSRVAEADWAT